MTVVRRAGISPLDGGSQVLWTLAEGARGRRWRATTAAPDGSLATALLLELAPNGKLSKLELGTPDGLLTLHPEPGDGRLHGNIVRPAGVEHVSIPWMPGDVLHVRGSPFTAAVSALGLADRIGVGEGESIGGLEVGPDLTLSPTTWHVVRYAERRWHLGPAGADGAAGLTIDLDEDGVPTGYPGERSWPLELPAGE